MIITDLFSHKIHSSGEDWPQKLIEIASVFADFDGLPYDRAVIEERFRELSPRASIVARDPSKYRDEISAYPAYLGLYRLELRDKLWILRLSETAKRFLVGEEPNVSSFMLLQLSMFQYPNGNGASFSNNGTARLQSNAGERTLGFINNKIHLSPFRLICKALLADSIISGINSLHPRVSIGEVSILCNDSRLNSATFIEIEDVVAILKEIRAENLLPIKGFERRFHILNHTDLIQVTNGWIHLRETFSPADQDRLVRILTLICEIDIQFNGFDNTTTITSLTEKIKDGDWSKYFDGVTQLSSEIVQEITGDYIDDRPSFISYSADGDELIVDNSAVIFKYPLKERGTDWGLNSPNSYTVTSFADPEVTRIKRQRSNLQHKILMSHLDEYLRLLGVTPMENEHIDIYASFPKNGDYLFEIKSVSSENLLSQTRKGLSQLYEYKYRYSNDISKNVTLCLVYPHEPKEIDWLQDYLCNDRNIAVLWFENDQLCYPPYCRDKLLSLIYKD